MVARARPRVALTDVAWGTALFECGVDYLEREEFEAAAVYFELLTASGWQIPGLPRLLAQTRATLKQIHLTHAHDVIERKSGVIKQLEDEINRRDTLLAQMQPEIDRRDQLLRELAIERQTEVDRRDGMLAELQRERVEAVAIRDRIVDELRSELDTMTRGWRRWVVRRPVKKLAGGQDA